MITDKIKTFARRLARPLRDNPQERYNRIFPTIDAKQITDVNSFVKQYEKVTFEIGFGDGIFTANYAANNPDEIILAAEPFINGVSKLIEKIEKRDLKNIRIIADDYRLLLEKLNKESIDKFFIICPDPWPKRKHHKRRVVNAESLKELATKLKKHGEINVITDHHEYAEWILKHAKMSGIFEISSEDQLQNFKIDPSKEGWVLTKYQNRGLKLGHHIYHFKLSLK